jgi:hypothetical protein
MFILARCQGLEFVPLCLCPFAAPTSYDKTAYAPPCTFPRLDLGGNTLRILKRQRKLLSAFCLHLGRLLPERAERERESTPRASLNF